MDKNLEHLRLLSLFYKIYGVILAVIFCFPLIHVSIGIAMVLGAFNGGHNPPPPAVGFFFIVIGAIIILFGWAFAICNFLTARYIKQRKNYLFCCIIAGLNCSSFPLGTVLGVFTFVVLFRDPVKQLFNGVHPAQFQPAAGPMTPPDWR